MKRGDIVIADFPFFDTVGSKKRPALVIQSDVYNAKLVTTVLAMISGNLRSVSDSAQCLIDRGTPDGALSGLRGPSVVKCNNIITISQKKVIHVIGKLSKTLMLEVERCLKTVLELP